MLSLRTPNGLRVDTPETLAEDPSPRFGVDEPDAIRTYYGVNGYVVVKGLLPAVDCDRMRALWDSEVKPFDGKMYRQATARLEAHRLNGKGWVMNPILNLQSVDPSKFPDFRRHAREQILSAVHLHRVFHTLFGEPGKIVQSMYFEGNSATWEHQDSYYLDSEHMGSMAAAWIALEDISATAGRFFVCPESHKLDWKRQSAVDNIATRHEVYVQSVVNHMRQSGADVRAPALRKGDVLFWNGLTIHGSIDSHDPNHSRSSITCHAIPCSHRLMQFQTRFSDPETETVCGVRIHAPKDLARRHHRIIRAIEGRAAAPFYALKQAAIRALIR